MLSYPPLEFLLAGSVLFGITIISGLPKSFGGHPRRLPPSEPHSGTHFIGSEKLIQQFEWPKCSQI
jgi:hypothetical protein